MLISCPACTSQYALDPARIGADGQKVRCAACRETWFVLPPAPEPATVDGQRSGDGFTVPSPTPGRRPPARAPLRRAPPPPLLPRVTVGAAALVLLAGLACLVGRNGVVARVPASAGLFAALGLPVNLVGLTLSEVSSGMTGEGSGRVLTVEGRIANPGPRPAPVPRLDLTVEGAAGQELYRWTATVPAGELGGGESTAFRLRLQSPPPDGRALVVAFEGTAAVAMR